MALTLDDLRTEVREAFASRSDLTDNRIARALHFGQERVAREPVHWKELERKVEFTVRAGVTSYPLDELVPNLEDLHELFSFRLTRDDWRSRLTYVPSREWEDLAQTYTISTPSYYSWWGEDVEVTPVPERDYQARVLYTIWPKPLTAVGQVSQLKNKDGIIIAFSISHLFQSFGNSESAARWFTIARDQLRSAKASVDYVSDTVSVSGMAGRSPQNYWQDPFRKRAP